MLIDQGCVIEFIDGVTVEKQFCPPGQAQSAPHRPVSPNSSRVGSLHPMQVKVEIGEKKTTVEAEGPKNNPVVEFALEGVDRVTEKNVLAVDVVGDVPIEEGREVLPEGGDRPFDLGLISGGIHRYLGETILNNYFLT